MGSYTVYVKFISQKAYLSSGVAILSLLNMGLFLFNRKEATILKSPSLALGNYQLKKDERKLVYEDNDMNLTEKETEILTILSDRPNQIISREELH